MAFFPLAHLQSLPVTLASRWIKACAPLKHTSNSRAKNRLVLFKIPRCVHISLFPDVLNTTEASYKLEYIAHYFVNVRKKVIEI